ncbi:MAG: hypothetical protein WCJ92_08390 [Alphaproteobacteria bacterium]
MLRVEAILYNADILFLTFRFSLLKIAFKKSEQKKLLEIVFKKSEQNFVHTLGL